MTRHCIFNGSSDQDPCQSRQTTLASSKMDFEVSQKVLVVIFYVLVMMRLCLKDLQMQIWLEIWTLESPLQVIYIHLQVQQYLGCQGYK